VIEFKFNSIRKAFRLPGLVCLALGISGCSAVMSSVTSDLADGLSEAIMDNDDIEVVRSGAPAYLILLDGLIAQSPDNADLLNAASTLNGAYAAAFVNDKARQIALGNKSFELAERAACEQYSRACQPQSQNFEAFQSWVAVLKPKHIDMAYSLATAWAGWIQVHSDDYNAIADLARVRALMDRVVELDEGYDSGGAHMYLGILDTLAPPALGGRPEEGRRHFERAIELSGGHNLMTKVIFARQYARLVFDRELHDRLLNEVLKENPRVDGITLINVVAQQQAKELLRSGDEYF